MSLGSRKCKYIEQNNKTQDYCLNIKSKPDLLNIQSLKNKINNGEKIKSKNIKLPDASKRQVLSKNLQNYTKKDSFSLNMYLQNKDNQKLNKKLIGKHTGNQNERNSKLTLNTLRFNKKYDTSESNYKFISSDRTNSVSLSRFDSSKNSFRGQSLIKKIKKVSSNLKLEIISNNGFTEQLQLYSEFDPTKNKACKTPILSKLLRK